MNWEEFKKPLVIAHRGDTKVAVENTLPAIASALKMGVDGVEVDLRLTRDGQIVLFHDDNLQGLADRPEAIESLSLNQVQEIRLRGGFNIPTLRDLLELAQDAPFLNLELKTARPLSGDLERKTLETIGRFSKKPFLLISSFQPLSLRRIRRLAPELATGYLFEKYWAIHYGLIPVIRPFSLNPPLNYLTQDLVLEQHRAERRVLVWTVNHENDMKRCIDAGVDGLITDEPKRLLTLLNR